VQSVITDAEVRQEAADGRLLPIVPTNGRIRETGKAAFHRR